MSADNTKPKIYESPDGGLTVYARDFGDPTENRVEITMPGNLYYDECTGWTHSTTNNNNFPLDYIEYDPIKEAIKSGSTFVDLELHHKYPELKETWENYKKLQKHYTAWDVLVTVPKK
jgi:hypothetical protein